MENTGIVQTYVFHDLPAQGLPHMVRATCTALVAEGGEVFIGVSVCSESEQFTKRVGREKSWEAANYKYQRWLRGKGGPDTIVPLPINVLGDEARKHMWTSVNKEIKHECLYAQLEKFRAMLSDRAMIIRAFEQEQLQAKLRAAYELIAYEG